MSLRTDFSLRLNFPSAASMPGTVLQATVRQLRPRAPGQRRQVGSEQRNPRHWGDRQVTLAGPATRVPSRQGNRTWNRVQTIHNVFAQATQTLLGRLRQANGESQVVARQTPESAPQTCRRVDLQVDIDSLRRRDSNHRANACDEIEQDALVLGTQFQRLRRFRRPRQQRFE